MANIMEITEAVHKGYLLKIKQGLKINKSKLSILNSSYIALTSLITTHYNEIISQIYQTEDNLLKLQSKISEDVESISLEDSNSINNLKIEPFVPRLKTDQILSEVSKYFKVNFEDNQDQLSVSLRNNLYLKSPKHAEKARMIIREITGEESKKDEKYLWDDRNENLSTYRNGTIHVFSGSKRISFNIKANIECIDQNEINNILAVGCQNGQAFIINKGQELNNSNPRQVEFGKSRSNKVSLTMVKFSESGRFLAFSNYNNQVFLFNDSGLVTEYKAEINSNKVALVNCITIDDRFAIFGNREGWIFLYSVEKKTWASIRPFVNSIQNAFISSDFLKFVVVSENLVKVYEFNYYEGIILPEETTAFPKNINQACLLVGNDAVLAVFFNKGLNLFDLNEKKVKLEVKGVFDFMVLTVQYPNLLKYWYFIEN